jgi:hypothetical protein
MKCYKLLRKSEKNKSSPFWVQISFKKLSDYDSLKVVFFSLLIKTKLWMILAFLWQTRIIGTFWVECELCTPLPLANFFKLLTWSSSSSVWTVDPWSFEPVVWSINLFEATGLKNPRTNIELLFTNILTFVYLHNMSFIFDNKDATFIGEITQPRRRNFAELFI